MKSFKGHGTLNPVIVPSKSIECYQFVREISGTFWDSRRTLEENL
jgi:hypothetical protein